MAKPWEEYQAQDSAKPWEEYQPKTQPVISTNPTDGNSFGQNALIATGKAFVDAGRGVGQIARSVLPEGVANSLSLPTDADISESRKLDAPLMDTAGGKVGNVAGNVALAIPTAFIPGANTYTGSALIGAGLGAIQPTTADESRVKNTAVGGSLGVISKFLADKAAAKIIDGYKAKQATVEASNIQNATRNANLEAGKEAGYVVPPTQANPSTTNQVLEGISGKIKTAQVASLKNQSVTNDLARSALNLPQDAPLTKETLGAVRDEAGKAYQAISSIPSIPKDATYQNAILSLKGAYSKVENEAPEIAGKYTKEFDNLISGMNKDEFSGEGANEIMKLLRYEGNNVSPTANAADKALGKAQIKAANALEDLIDRTLTKQGNTEAVGALRDARATIAKSYDIEKALTERGNVDAGKIASILKKGRLTGDLEKIGKFAATFPKATQEINSSIPATSPLDWYGAIGTSAATGNPLPLALAGVRPSIRSTILSPAYQAAMARGANAAPGMAAQLGNKAANSELLLRAAPALGTLGGFTYGKE